MESIKTDFEESKSESEDLESEYIPSYTYGPKSALKPAPKPTPLLFPSKLKKVLESTSYQDKNKQYDRESYFDAEWAELVIRNLKESSSKSVAKRKNQKRAQKERIKIEHKLDKIFRTYDDVIEYEVIEVKSKFVQINSTDRLKDGLKLEKAMHNIFVCLKKGLTIAGYWTIAFRRDKRFNHAPIRCLESKELMNSTENTEDEFIQSIINSGTTTPPPKIKEEIQAFQSKIKELK
ncbi:hypothetical protein C1645_740460 [Glomus cerebriforme]|uniref:Uncharacterized protein n=1 Tax=Glomus cerebriforme TaxID=658196 RepID=A0A397SVR8_9GLOM|nr:hypothetical protein C1645_740460 [Glomus cerebriforme]